jgi:integrase
MMSSSSNEPAADGRPQTLLAALNSPAVTGQLGPEILRCVGTDLATLARLSDLSKSTRHRWHREEIEQQLARLPCDPELLRPILEAVRPSRLRIKERRWVNCKSSTARILRLTGWIDDQAWLKIVCAPEWARLRQLIAGQQDAHVFQGFARFCTLLGARPSEVTKDTLQQYRHWILSKTLKLGVGQRISHVRMIWNRQASSSCDWPQRRLAPPPDPRKYAKADELDPAYIAKVDDYLQKMRHRNPLDPLFPKAVGEATLVQKRGVLLHAGYILLSEGCSIEDLVDVTKPNAIRIVLLDLYNRLGKGKEWPSSAVYTARHLLETARYVRATDPASLSDADLLTIRGYCKLVRVPNAHLLAKVTRDRLAILESPDTEERFLRIPDEAFDEADRLLAEGRRSQAAHLHQAALALAIDICKPLRGGMLARLDQRHFQRDDHGRIIALHIPAEEMEKSKIEVEAAISRKLANRITRHERVYIPIIVNGNATTALFPNSSGRSMNRVRLSQAVVTLVEKKIGIAFNLHLLRHWAANLILDEDPRNGAIVQHLLTHRSPMSKSRYGAARTRSAHRQYASMLDRKVSALKRRNTLRKEK